MKAKLIAGGYLINNPGHMQISSYKFQGEKPESTHKELKEFFYMAYGYCAMFVLLDVFRKQGIDTVGKIINKWGGFENNKNIDYYLDCAERWTGIPKDKKLSECSGKEYIKIVSVISRLSNGIEANKGEVLAGFDLQNRIR